MSGLNLRLIRGGKIVDSGGTSHEIKEIRVGTNRIWYPPTINPTTNTWQGAGGSFNFTIDACAPWELNEYPSWLTFSVYEGDRGLTTITATCEPNQTGERLSGRILVTYKHTIQLWCVALVYQEVTDSISISPIRVSGISSEGDVIDVAITTSSSWEIAAQSMFWATTSKRYGSQSETIQVTVAENTTGAERNGTITFANGSANATLQLYQLAVIPVPTFDVQPRSKSVGSLGQLIILTVTADASWTATTSASWITLPSSGGSAGTSPFTIECAENTNTRQRVGTVLFSSGSTSIMVTITQAGRVL